MRAVFWFVRCKMVFGEYTRHWMAWIHNGAFVTTICRGLCLVGPG